MLTSSYIKSQAIEIIPDKLYWISDKHTPVNKPKSYFFNIDQDLVYEPFFFDFGPVDIGKVCRFVIEVNNLLQCSQFAESRLYHHTSLDSAKRANAAFLMAAFQIISLHRTAEEAWEPFKRVKPALAAFRDAYDGECNYECTILDCLRGLEYAINLGWFNIRTFDLKCYEHYEKVENGDLSWIIPGKLLAFSSPLCTSRDAEGYKRFTPEDYIPIFKKLKIKKVVRLCGDGYDATKFVKNGIKHQDLPFPGSSCPSDQMIDKFLSICEEEKDEAIAVHCRDGLVKASILIACYAMKHYKFSAASLIAWMRLCRPGSIVNKQQEFLIDKEADFSQSLSDLASPGACSSGMETYFSQTDIDSLIGFGASKCLGPKICHVKIMGRQLKSDP